MNLRRGGSTWLPNFEYNPDMIIRAKNMLALLDGAEYKSVLDLGCGVQYLRELIPTGVEYLGVDLYKHKDDTIICDFNKKQFPNLNSAMVKNTAIKFASEYSDCSPKLRIVGGG